MNDIIMQRLDELANDFLAAASKARMYRKAYRDAQECIARYQQVHKPRLLMASEIHLKPVDREY